ncbi:MAG: radical SAM protein [Syntrophomonas sp.]
MDQTFKKIVNGAQVGKELSPAEIKELLAFPVLSEESYYVQFAARQMNEEINGGQAEIHGQVGVNTAPCPGNCEFCSFAASNQVFRQHYVEPIEEIIARCLKLEKAGANAIYLMATANFSFEQFLSIGKTVRKYLQQETVLVSNTGDFGYGEAVALKEAGFNGIYHAVRLGEGEITRIPVEKRLQTMQAVRQAGLKLGTCVEPVGPEHSLDELVEKILLTREAGAVFSGAARRIPIPDTNLSNLGIVSEARMAQILAVVGLATGLKIPGNCTHEPNVHGVVAGANLLWAEAGSNPRDIVNDTENSRGFDVARCRQIFEDAETKVLSGPSRFFAAEV